MRRILDLLEQSRTRDALNAALARSDERPIRGLLPTLAFLNEERPLGLGWIRRLCDENESVPQLCRLAHLAAQVGAFRLAERCLEKARRSGSPEEVLRTEELRQARLRGQIHRAYRLAEGPEEKAALAARLGKMEQALDLYARVGGAYGHHQRAEIFLRRGDQPAARRDLKKALQEDPGYLWSRWRQAQALALEGDLAAALAELEKIDPDFRQRADLLRAAWLERLARHEEAERIRRPYCSPVVLGRLRELRAGSLIEWRQYSGRERAMQLKVHVLGELATEGLKSWFERELPYSRWALKPSKARGPLYFEELSAHVLRSNKQAVARLARLKRLSEEQAVLVVVPGEAPWRANRGYGGSRLALVQADPEDLYLESVVAHELGHALLGLQHNDGLKFYEDAFCLMGYPGSMSPLELSYLDFRQKAAMMTFPGRSEQVEEAWELEKKGFFDRAEREYRHILRRDPLDHWVRGRLARLALGHERLQEGFKRVRQLRRRDLSYELAAWQGELLVRHGQSELPGYPDHDPGARLARGRARLRALDYQGGAFDLHVSDGLSPESKEAIFSLACLALERGQFARAEQGFKRCLKAWPNWGEAWRRLALGQAEQGHYHEAEKLLWRANWLQQDSADHAWHEGQLAWLAGDFDKSLRDFVRCQRWAPEEQVPHFHLAYWEVCINGIRRATLRHFSRCHRMDPTTFLGRASAAWLAALEGRGKQARELAAPLLRRVPRHGPLVYLMVFLGKPWEERLRGLEPNHPRLESPFLP
ncbi:hypothetical protein DYH09_13120 [bacterium CPR1]|nr:hypothetical protein [bacterium CPR1]